MPEERLITISSSSHLAPDEVARHSFGSVRRGYDTSEVRAYLESIAMSLQTLAERERQLLEELADAEHRAANPVIDEPTLSAAVGSETARVLHSAHEAAAEMVAKSEVEANRLLSEAREDIEQSRAQTENRLAELTAESEAAANELRERTAQQATAHLEAVRLEAEEMLAQAREQCRSMIDEAQGLRTRVLADLAKRRKVLHAQIEQLRAGRERLAETVKDVRRSVDVIAEDLFAAEDNARLAAETAGREALDRPDEGTPEELAALLLADEADAAPARAAEPAEGAQAGEATGSVEVTEELEVL
jgi:DivIVA domain-containing protein